MSGSEYTREEIARIGREIYERDIRPEVEPDHRGEFVVVDVDSGDYEIANEALTATNTLRQRRPGAVPYLMRIGHAAAYRLGGCNPAPRA